MRLREVEPLALRRLPDRLTLCLAGAVELELARVPTILGYGWPRGDDVGDVEVSGERADDLLRRRRDDEHAPSKRAMQRHEVERLLIHVGIDRVDQLVGDEVLDGRLLPPLREREHRVLRALHPLVVGAHEQVHQLRVRATQERAPRDHPRSVHGTR